MADFDPGALRSVVEHVFMPPNLPQASPGELAEQNMNVALCRLLIEAAQTFLQNLPSSQRPAWMHMIKMMELARRAAEVPLEEADIQRSLSNMVLGDVFAMHIRAQNAALIVRRPAITGFVQFEIFEVSPLTTAVMSSKGKLLCSYPGPAIQLSEDTFTDECFLQELASFLVKMDVDILDSASTSSKAGSIVHEVRESAHPRYISELLVGILRGFGKPAVVDRITKRIGDEVLWNDAYKPWRRSPLWLILKVTMQTSLRVTNLYKYFMLHFHAYLLLNCTRREFPSELLYTMRVKAVRRLSKLGSVGSYGVYEFVHGAAQETEAIIQKRWSAFQDVVSVCPPWRPEELDSAVDTAITLDNSRQYLERMLRLTSHSHSRRRFIPSHGSRLNNVHDFIQFTKGKLTQAIVHNQRVALADFEFSVEKYLKDWITGSLYKDDAPLVIASCIEQYFAGANDLYGTNAEDNSIMILTIVDLWVALDTLTIQKCRLLNQYSPEISPKFLHSLLLHHSGSLRRAQRIEEYLSQRHKGALYTTSVFSNSVVESSFYVQYFRTSDTLQHLYDDIKTHAQQERSEKRLELATLNQQSRSLNSEASTIDHEHYSGISGNMMHNPTCRKCQLEIQAQSLKIRAHEWPLPSSTLEAQRVVFELSPPDPFPIWRDVTYTIIRDIGMSGVFDSQSEPKIFLDSFSGLSRWVVWRELGNRVAVGSTTKSFSDQTHYKMVGIPAEESSVLVNNGLSLKLYDRTHKSWVVGPFSEANVEKLCAPSIPTSSPYSPLFFSVSGTQHTSNGIIAAQGDCPKEISLHEFMAFSGLRSGPLLQWLNIARELASPSLSFRREEVHTLITQAAWQLGPLSNGSRKWHVDLGTLSFGRTLLRELESLLEKVAANWLEEVTVRTISLLSSRLLASATDPDISDGACLTYRWVYELGAKLDSTPDEISRAGLRRRLCMLAMTCFSTFDVCSRHLPRILFSDEDFAIAVQCAVMVHDNTPSSLEEDDGSLYLTRMLDRHYRLLHFLEPIFSESTSSHSWLRQVILVHARGYDHALESLWLGYRGRASSDWRALTRQNSRWITRLTEGGQEVHYNLLTGQLLIDGKPLGRLPQEIVDHPTYASVLGTRILDVAPADIPGMEFMTRSTVSGYQILFSRSNGDVILQIRRPGSSQLLQLVPRSTFSGDLPRNFIDEYVHWLDLGTGEVEFRPAGSPWTSDPSNWRLHVHKPSSQPDVMIRKSTQNGPLTELIDIRSSTFRMVSSLLSALESPEHFVITHTAQVLEVSLPRFRLSFFVNKNEELECRSISGYVVDMNQSCGTLFGLTNQLVLCPSRKAFEESLQPRRVIIPQGNVSFTMSGDFNKVSIDCGNEKYIRWHEYTVDADLGRLASNASLTSELYKCYLHALTSHCLPDPLLGHTGTEEALYILRSATCRSFQRLEADDAKLLELISKLTPDRLYYPPHMQSMATVEWNNLTALSQHHDFHPTVCSIFDHARALETLYDRPTAFTTPNRNPLLLLRAVSRNKVYYPQDLQGSEYQSSPDDVRYKSRDVSDKGTAEHLAYQTSRSIWYARPPLNGSELKLWDKLNSWGSLGPASNEVLLSYSRYWLNFDAPRDWFAIYDLCRQAENGVHGFRDTRFTLSFCLSAASYGKSEYAEIVPVIMAFATDGRFQDLSPPPESSYTLSDGLSPELARLKDLIYESALPMESTPAQTMNMQVTKKKVGKQRKAAYDKAITSESSLAAQSVFERWPDYLSAEIHKQWFDISDCNRRVERYLQSISRNVKLREHLLQLQRILEENHHDWNVSVPAAVSYVFSPHFMANPSRASTYSIQDVLTSRTDVPTTSTLDELTYSPDRSILFTATAESGFLTATSDGLESLIQEFQHSQRSLLQLYGNDLDKSHKELLRKDASAHKSLRRYRDDCSLRKDKIFSEIVTALSPSQTMENLSRIAGLWPRISPRSILRQLAHDRIRTLPDGWKIAITRYATAFLQYQQSQRLLEFFSRQQYEELIREAGTVCKDVAADSTPDWLLIQIEANILARPIQLTVAREMISPGSKRNISLQLNMGEGKSSVIVPFVASSLASGSNLVRIVTLKPLSNQMFQLLTSRLSFLANRPIFYVPFSRSLCMSIPLIQTIRDLYKRCVAEGGVLVVQPEHILSQKLMHIDTVLTSTGNREKRAIAHDLGALQDWVTEASRDVLDESDEILHVRYQLVYTAGKQMPVDDHPSRWTTIQQVLSRLRAHASQLHASYPKRFELDQTQKEFPIMRILDHAISQKISSLIVDDALSGALFNLPLTILPPPVREATRRFITQKRVSDEDRSLIHSHCSGTSLWNGILLLRGLLMDGEGILYYVLKARRWRVDYGLDSSRTLLAVPYRAKDVPSLRAEFGHPDVAITLTCLSYYYGGLTRDQLLLCFDLLAKIDNPEIEYDHWVGFERDLPTALCQLNGVNQMDEAQVDEFLMPLFSRNTRVVDFYLSYVVFPRAAREFPSKLPTSGWDLVEEKKNVTTGFSGTNDNRYLLPTSINQEDPASQLSTNALVLQYLLQSENNYYECTEGENGEREPAEAFLQRIVNQNPPIRVLLDVGAQMLELQNQDLAQHWLSLLPDISAAIFFNDDDHLTVLTQDGTIQPFISSPLNRQLDKCVVYLDDAHTRGTDLKLPQGTHRLLQGCMRMRQLGKGHSVMFFAPGEVDRRIRSLIPNGRAFGSRIRVLDVVRWAMYETCEDIRHHLPHWAGQGLDHHKRFKAYKQYKSSGNVKVLKNAWLQPESRTLEETYDTVSSTGINPEINDIPAIGERVKHLGAMDFVDVRMAEEQEREVNHEIEREHHLERPGKVQLAQHLIHEDIRTFVATGEIPSSSKYILPLFAPLGIDEELDSMVDWSPSPLATADFATTTMNSTGTGLTDYLRPVNWILSSGSGRNSTFIVISPHEANELLPVIRESEKVRLHLYAPRVTTSMRSFSDLTFYSIPDLPTPAWTVPTHIRTELNLFAGQLYFDTREDYMGAVYSEMDGFVPPEHRTGKGSPFKTSKISILKKFIGLRRKGMGYERTHLGQVLNARPLSEEAMLGSSS
ncbi:hypothetical protein B0F90DRAFT_1913825 [Multifurca ochricompacta]|uniref:ubiquitinyl hydrolase 1 n=2 Tax=Multifurca ochricompacta TaxID=376703 RepID=A0AAD4LTZ7_9AGAM|nr:hypothetical protein B0F90DRAFT_1913825 [Multifurca ochricompacta]